jgi:hypothetical protein
MTILICLTFLKIIINIIIIIIFFFSSYSSSSPSSCTVIIIFPLNLCQWRHELSLPLISYMRRRGSVKTVSR